MDLFPLKLEPLFPQASQLLSQKISLPIPQVGKARSPTPEGSCLTLPIPFCSANLAVLQIRPIESAGLRSLLKHKKALGECSWPAGLPLRLRYVRNKRVRRVILLVDTEKLLIFIGGLLHHFGFPHFDFLGLKSIPQALPPRVGVGVLGGEYDSSDGDF